MNYILYHYGGLTTTITATNDQTAREKAASVASERSLPVRLYLTRFHFEIVFPVHFVRKSV